MPFVARSTGIITLLSFSSGRALKIVSWNWPLLGGSLKSAGLPWCSSTPRSSCGSGRRALDRVHAVETDVVRVEHDAAVEHRQELLAELADVLVPQLKLPAPLRLPAFVHVDQDVQPAVPAAVAEHVEVEVDVEVAAGAGGVQAAADELFVGQEVGHAGDELHQLEEVLAVEQVVELLERLGEDAGVGDLELPLLVDVGEGDAELLDLVVGREGVGAGIGEIFAQEVVDLEPGNRLGVLELVRAGRLCRWD